jgi:hypothetical protein
MPLPMLTPLARMPYATAPVISISAAIDERFFCAILGDDADSDERR